MPEWHLRGVQNVASLSSPSSSWSSRRGKGGGRAPTGCTSVRSAWLAKLVFWALAAIACLQLYSGHSSGSSLDTRRIITINAARRGELPHDQKQHGDLLSPTGSYLGPLTLDSHASDVFKPSTALRPWQPDNFYEGFPVSDLRPHGQFYVPASPSHHLTKPVITIITATRNPREIFFTRTVRFVLQQSLQMFRWVIVNDGSDDQVSMRRLDELRRWAAVREPYRILVVDRPTSLPQSQQLQGNGPAAMNYGLRFVSDDDDDNNDDGTPHSVVILDDDDMWELTTLEKAALVMSWVPQAHAVSLDVVNHGAQQFLWKRGFFNGDESFFTENNLMQGSPFRSSVLRQCRFREDMAEGGADWDFWMCMASHGMWGLHVPEHGNWYQWNPPEFRRKRWRAVTTHKRLAELRDIIQQRYANLLEEGAWPPMVLPPRMLPSSSSSSVRESGDAEEELVEGRDDHPSYRAPFANRVGNRSRGQKAVMLVLRDLTTSDREGATSRSSSSSSNNNMDGNSSDVVECAKRFAQAGWRVTVLMTHYTDDDGGDGSGDNNNNNTNSNQASRRRQELMQYTHDVYVGANVAPLLKLPDLVAYLVDTRGAEAVVVLADSPSDPAQISRRLVNAALAMLRGVVTPKPVVVVDVAENSLKTAEDVMRATERAVLAIRPAAARQQPADRHHRSAAGGRHIHQQTAWPAFVESLISNSPAGALSKNHQRHVERGIDMRQVQLALQYRKKRTGFGRELQIACPERVYANTQWIDALEHPRACDDGGGGGVDSSLFSHTSLQRSAMTQCGAWCLATVVGRLGSKSVTGGGGGVVDPSIEEIGWEFTGSCFRPIHSPSDSPKCQPEIARRRHVLESHTTQEQTIAQE